MYFPYIRGRQYELLALKDLVEKNLICEEVIPIVEPIKLTSTLINTVSGYIQKNRKISVIRNPRVGNFLAESKKVQPQSKEEARYNTFESHCASEFVIPALLMDIDTGSFLEHKNASDFLIVHNDSDFIDDYERLFKAGAPCYTLIPDERPFKRSAVGARILFEDKFKKRMRNADYAKKPDEPFSEDHLLFKNEGYAGFSDYSVIGNDYVEAGFAPYAIAIHIVYFDDDKKLRIQHFVSDSNDDIENPAGKYYEALIKLNTWYHSKVTPPQTTGISIFLEHYNKQIYPGLGTVKKLSLMHHLELVSQFLKEKS